MGILRRRNPLKKYFIDNPGRLINKWDHYFDIYDRHMAQFRGRPVTILEIGVFHGGSLQMWRKYFGKRARIIGLDVDERTLSLASDDLEVVLGDQSDKLFLSELAAKIGPLDIVIDDGGLWPFVADGGVYLVEDLHTSYWPEFGGGYLKPGTFIEYAKLLVDQQHAWHARPDDGLIVDDMTRSIRGIHLYDSVAVFDRAKVERPYSQMTGMPAFPLFDYGA
jgi:23S rRNA U2552 (ribose-2'-O)-methylase RlmE/FtsJ